MGLNTIMIVTSFREFRKKNPAGLDAYLASKGVVLEKRGTDDWWAIPNVGLPYRVDMDADLTVKGKELRISGVSINLNSLVDEPD